MGVRVVFALVMETWGALAVTSCTTQCLNVGFLKMGDSTPRSAFIQRKREGSRGSRLLHSPPRQARDAITHPALGNRLKVIEVGRARVRQSVFLGEREFRGKAADCRGNRDGDGVQNGNREITGTRTGRFLSGVLKLYQQTSPRFTKRRVSLRFRERSLEGIEPFAHFGHERAGPGQLNFGQADLAR